MSTKKENKKISSIIRIHLLQILLTVFALSMVVVIIIQGIFSREYAYVLIEEYIRDVSDETDDDFHDYIKDTVDAFHQDFEDELDDISDEWLEDLVRLNPELMSEINVVDENGIIVYSSVPEYVGFDMNSGEQSAEFLCLLNGTDYYEQTFRGNAYDESIVMAYAGKAFDNGRGFLQIGLSEDKYYELVEKTYQEVVRHRRIGLIGFIAVLNKDFECIGSTHDMFNGSKKIDPSLLPENEGEYRKSKGKIDGTDCYVVATLKDGYYIIGGFPVSESRRSERIDIIIMTLIIVLLLICVFFTVSKSLHVRVVKCIEDIHASLAKITGGDLTERVDVKSSLEFEELSEGINDTVEKLNQMIEEADKRLDKELEMARVIQSTSIPNVFPPFPKRTDIGLFAMMDTAKEVGGDFYDYYMLPGNRLALIIADVSDKGIPAALFMMKANTVIKALAVSGLEVDEVMTRANDELVKDNEAEMFVTVWIGFLDLDTGLISYVHAGHTCPMLIRDGEVSMIKQKRNFIVGGRAGIRFLKQEFQLLPGDTVFLYTDGVTEAFDKDHNEYGNERLENILLKEEESNASADPNKYCEELCELVREDVASYAADVPQSDDITMLAFRYMGKT